MGDWAMAHGGMKKRLAWHFYQRRDLESADAFHCTSELEAEEVRKLGFRQPIEVIPNGITRPACLPERHERSGRRALFLSRIHPKKGLVNLVRAWKQANVSQDWKLMIAGPDESGHQAEVEAEVRSLGLTDQVEFPGPISDDRKWQYYVDGDLFVLPSFSENFGIVIAEAMAAGLPVITTTGTPWSVLNERGLGWWMEPTVESLSAAIAEACAQDLAALRKRGAFARKFAIAQFSWTDVAQRLKLFYENTLGSR